MEYQNTKADERFLAKMDREENEMLLKLYDLKKSDINCPKNPYLLQPDRLNLASYEVLPDNIIKLNIGYSRNWSGFVTDTIRMNYTQYIFGTLFCERIESYNQVDFNKNGTIKIPFLSNSKILNLPVLNNYNINIRCKKIRVQDIDIYVKNNDGTFILDEIYREQLKIQLGNKVNS